MNISLFLDLSAPSVIQVTGECFTQILGLQNATFFQNFADEVSQDSWSYP